MMDHLFARPPVARPTASRLTLADAAKRNQRCGAIGMTPADYDAAHLPAPEHTAIELKADGFGICYRAGALSTLEGVPIDAARHLLPSFRDLEAAFGQPMFIQGEWIDDTFDALLSAFRTGETCGTALIFEAVPLPAWAGDEPSAPLFDRRGLLETAFSTRRPAGIGLMPHAQGFDQEGVEIAAGIAWQDGHEGLVTKDLTSPFVRAKSRFWMKVKRTVTLDLPIQSIAVTGRRLDYIIVTFDRRPIKIAVGFSERQRHQLGDFVPGRIAEIKHLGVTKAGALKSASFLRFRDDKVS